MFKGPLGCKTTRVSSQSCASSLSRRKTSPSPSVAHSLALLKAGAKTHTLRWDIALCDVTGGHRWLSQEKRRHPQQDVSPSETTLFSPSFKHIEAPSKPIVSTGSCSGTAPVFVCCCLKQGAKYDRKQRSDNTFNACFVSSDLKTFSSSSAGISHDSSLHLTTRWRSG